MGGQINYATTGEADAENDLNFLADCFVDIGDFEVIENTEAPQSIVLGRTGIGKSALLEQLETRSGLPMVPGSPVATSAATKISSSSYGDFTIIDTNPKKLFKSVSDGSAEPTGCE